MDQSPCETDSILTGQKSPSLLWNPKIYYRVTRTGQWSLPALLITLIGHDNEVW